MNTHKWQPNQNRHLDKMASCLHHQLATPQAAQKGCLHSRAGTEPKKLTIHSRVGTCPRPSLVTLEQAPATLPIAPTSGRAYAFDHRQPLQGWHKPHQPYNLLQGRLVLHSHASHSRAGTYLINLASCSRTRKESVDTSLRTEIGRR